MADEFLTTPEVKLLLIEAVDSHHEKLKEELPLLMKPMMEEVSRDTAKACGKKLGIDFDSVDSMNEHHRSKDFIKKKMAAEANIKGAVLKTAVNFSVAGFMGWAAATFLGGK